MINGINTIDEAMQLKGNHMFIPDSEIMRIAPDNYYALLLLDFKVLDEKGDDIGEVFEINNFGGGDLLEVKDSKDNCVFYPYQKEVIKEINFDDKTVIFTNNYKLFH